MKADSLIVKAKVTFKDKDLEAENIKDTINIMKKAFKDD